MDTSLENTRKRRGRRTSLTLGKKKFKRCKSLEEIHIPDLVGSQGTENVGDVQFTSQSTQVTPLKRVSSLNQTEESYPSSSNPTTGYSSQTSSFELSFDTRDDSFDQKQMEENEEEAQQNEGNNSLPPLFSHLNSTGILEKLSAVLYSHGQQKDFSNLLTNIALRKIDPQNICWLLNLHLARLTSVSTTTLMRWDQCVVEFFSVIYILFGASAINVLRGPMNFSELVMEKMEKGLFDPLKARINLPIPSVTTLRSLGTGYPKQVPAGLVEHTLDIAEVAAQNGCQYILSFDGKMVAKGFKGDTFGDIDLWGIEKPISLQSSLRLVQQNINAAKRIDTALSSSKLFSHIQNLHTLVNHVSRRIKTLRSRISGEHYLRLKLVKLAHNQDMDRRKQFAYRMQLSYLNEHSARCDSNIGRCLHVNHRILTTLAATRRNSSVFAESKVVLLHEQNNAFHLLPTEIVRNSFDLSLTANSDIVKQRSEEWFRMRKDVKVTGSTLHNALGLESLADLKQHHYQFIKKRQRPPFPEEVQKRLDYGKENEKHAIASVIGGFMCAFKPACYVYQEVGSLFLTVYSEEKFMLVSPDGVMRCVRGDNCLENNQIEDHSLFPIEAKCVFPDPSKPLQPMYEVPSRYVPQCLSEMAVYKSTGMWFVSFTPTSISLIQMTFDAVLWEKMLSIAFNLHGGEKPKVPTKLHPQTKELKEDIRKYVSTKCVFICEVPSFRGVETVLRQSEVLSPHSFCSTREREDVDIDLVQRQSKVITFDCLPLFESIHNTLRQEAQEVLVFMLSDHNRHHEEFIPYSLPLGYAMKGKSLSNAELRHLIGRARKELARRGIPILCEVYDGQWQNLCMQSEDGSPLNKLRLVKPTWQRVQKLTKEKCLELLILAAKVKKVELENMSNEMRLERGEKHYYNIVIEKGRSGALKVTSTGGSTFSEPAIQHIATVTETSRPDVFDGTYTNLEEEEPVKKTTRKSQYGLREEEKSLAHLLDKEIIQDIENDIGEEMFPGEDVALVSEKDMTQMLLNLALNHSEISLLNDILSDLKEFNGKKWANVTCEQLFPGILADPSRLNKECTLVELNVISRAIEQRTGRKFVKSGTLKAVNVNMISEAFGGENFLLVQQRRSFNAHRVESLQCIARKVLMDNEYKLLQLQISLADALHREKKEKWKASCPLRRWGYVPHVFDEHLVFEYFSYPEYCEERKQVEFRTLDCTHMLTNMKTHILTRGYDFCPKEHFQELATLKPDLLSRPLVFDNIDQQNAFSAMQMFSEPVEDFIRTRGHTQTADFILLVRKWFAACDKRGLCADLRVTWLHEMYTFLTKDISFNVFPFPLTGRYWRGMPLQTYEALLQNICTRIQLYKFAHNRTYNCRAVSTLANESFFSDMGRLDKESRSYPKACNVPKIFGRVVTLNYYKHLPEKNWFLTTTHKGTYPAHLAEHNEKEYDDGGDGDNFYKNHFFDFPDDHTSQRCRRADISRGTQPLRFAGGVRKFFRGDESRILPESRAGMQPKGLPQFDETTGSIRYDRESNTQIEEDN